MEIYSICILKLTEIFTELSLSMFTVGGNSLSGKIHPGQETDEIIFTFQLRGNLTAPFSQLTLRWGTWHELMTILRQLSLQSWNFPVQTASLWLTWQYEGQHSVHLYSTLGDQWPPRIRRASSLVSEINPWRSENAHRGRWGDGKSIPNWGKTWQFRSSRVPKTIPKVRGSLWASHVLGYRHFLTVSVSLLGPDLFPGVWICQQPTWKGEDQDQDREGEVRIEDLIFRISAPPG